jgi:peptidoglycan hydrolase-like protein with peptidoglycan-binding domain
MVVFGMRGHLVTQLQRSLNFLGITETPLVEDGAFGPKTKAAVEDFQRVCSIASDGMVGPETSCKLVTATILQGNRKFFNPHVIRTKARFGLK